MHAISSYRGNRPTNTYTTPARCKQTGPITIHCATKLHEQCNNASLMIMFPLTELLPRLLDNEFWHWSVSSKIMDQSTRVHFLVPCSNHSVCTEKVEMLVCEIHERNNTANITCKMQQQNVTSSITTDKGLVHNSVENTCRKSFYVRTIGRINKAAR